MTMLRFSLTNGAFHPFPKTLSQTVSDGDSPAPDAAGLDVILMPCMAFDQDLNRLGHGKGYYDNFLTRYCSAKTADGQNRRKPFLGMYRRLFSIFQYCPSSDSLVS
jgi:5-formyltetrahydrofolate cyclo-ligase